MNKTFKNQMVDSYSVRVFFKCQKVDNLIVTELAQRSGES